MFGTSFLKVGWALKTHARRRTTGQLAFDQKSRIQTDVATEGRFFSIAHGAMGVGRVRRKNDAPQRRSNECATRRSRRRAVGIRSTTVVTRMAKKGTKVNSEETKEFNVWQTAQPARIVENNENFTVQFLPWWCHFTVQFLPWWCHWLPIREGLRARNLAVFDRVEMDSSLARRRDSDGSPNAPPKTYESNFFHHNFVEFRKQHSRYPSILSSIVLSLQCCEVYFIFLQQQSWYETWLANITETAPSPKLNGWIRPAAKT